MQDLQLPFPGGVFVEFQSAEIIRSNPVIIPNSPGIYAVIKAHEKQLLYIGQAKGRDQGKPRTLRDRFLKEHFKERARGSRLRRLIAIELGIKLFKDASGGLAAEPKDEPKITAYLNRELGLSFLAVDWIQVDSFEVAAIKSLKPKWNIQHAAI